MASVLAKLLGAVFPRKNEYRGLFLGLDASGRTTLLYLLKLGEVVTTIPTIGFNVETVAYGTTSLTIWDVGGCDKIRPLWRHYFQNTQVVAYFVDSNDRGRLAETRLELGRMLREDELRGVPVLMIFSKRDLPTAMPEEEMEERMNLRELLKGRVWRRVGTSSSDPQSTMGALLALCELCEATDKPQQPEQPKAKDAEVQLWRMVGSDVVVRQLADGEYENVETFERVETDGKQLEVGVVVSCVCLLKFAPRQQKVSFEAGTRAERQAQGMAALFLGWLSRVDQSDDAFLAAIDDYSLDVWDHYTHLRMAHLLMLRHGRRKAIPRIFDAIRLFIENSKRTTGKTFHVTMTYFWCHMVDYAMFQAGERGKVWKTFLLLNPQFANGGMYLHYYSKHVMMTPVAKGEVVLPDKVQLPSLLSQVARPAISAAAPNLKPDLPADAFLENVRSGRVSEWGHRAYIRVIVELLQDCGRREARDLIFRHLSAVEKSAFNATLCMFWIQMVHLSLARRGVDVSGPVAKGRVPVDELVDVQDSFLYRQYYSDKVLFDESAVREVLLPDLKPFPQK